MRSSVCGVRLRERRARRGRRRSSRHALDETARHLDVDALEQAVGLVERTSTLIFACMGSSSIAAENAVGRFTHADVCLLTAEAPGEGVYGETVTAKWGQLLVIDALYAAYAARHFDETVDYLKASFSTVIQRSRS
jgi:DNA-binding MurR/RpiR family transcriptional regulator